MKYEAKEIKLNMRSPKNEKNISENEKLEKLLNLNLQGKINVNEKTEEIVKNLIQYDILKLVNLQKICEDENLDFGDSPLLLGGAQESAAESVFIIPNSNPTRIIIEYCECSPYFNKISNLYENSFIYQNQISEQEFSDTIKNADNLLYPLRGWVSKLNFWLYILMIFGTLCVITGAIICGFYVSWIITIIILIVYAVGLGVGMICTKNRNAKTLLYSQIALALYSKSENLRIYEKHNINFE